MNGKLMDTAIKNLKRAIEAGSDENLNDYKEKYGDMAWPRICGEMLGSAEIALTVLEVLKGDE